MKTPTFTTDHIQAEVHRNPYEPGAEVHIEAKNATVEEVLELRRWLDGYLGQVYYSREDI